MKFNRGHAYASLNTFYWAALRPCLCGSKYVLCIFYQRIGCVVGHLLDCRQILAIRNRQKFQYRFKRQRQSLDRRPLRQCPGMLPARFVKRRERRADKRIESNFPIAIGDHAAQRPVLTYCTIDTVKCIRKISGRLEDRHRRQPRCLRHKRGVARPDNRGNHKRYNSNNGYCFHGSYPTNHCIAGLRKHAKHTGETRTNFPITL